MAEEPTSENAPGIPYKIECRRSYLHRYIPADGAWVGLNVHGKIILNFYNDSPLLPKMLIPETTADGKKFTSKEAEIILEAEAKSFRQFEVSVNLSLVATKVLVETLKNFIKMAEDRDKANVPK